MPVDTHTGSDRPRRRPVFQLMVLAALGLVLVLVLALPAAALAGVDPVADMFHRLSDTSKTRSDGSKIPPNYVRVDEIGLTDGRRVSLWVSDPAQVNQHGDRCWYLQLTTGESRYVGGVAACGSNGEERWLRRSLGAIVGNVGSFSAQHVTVTAPDGSGSQRIRVAGQFYLVPTQFDLPNTKSLVVSHYGDGGELIGTSNLEIQ